MKTIKLNLPGILVAVIFIMIALFACQKEVSFTNGNIPGKSRLSVFLTDGPYDFQQVKVEVLGIEVKIDTCRHMEDDDHDDDQPGCDDDHDSLRINCDVWNTLQVHPGIYDLLKLRNGLDTLLASGFVLHGKIERIKIILGTGNTVMVDSVVHPLHLMGNRNFVFVNIHKEHVDSVSSYNFNLFLDFNLFHSIKLINGEYWLKPVIKPFGEHSSGEIEGKVRPEHSFGIIKAYNATDTSFAVPEDEGGFKIRGLKDGMYNLFVAGINGYRDTTINNINVRRGSETELGAIYMRR